MCTQLEDSSAQVAAMKREISQAYDDLMATQNSIHAAMCALTASGLYGCGHVRLPVISTILPTCAPSKVDAQCKEPVTK